MKINVHKIMKSNYDVDFMGSGKSITSKKRTNKIFKTKINREISRQFYEELNEN